MFLLSRQSLLHWLLLSVLQLIFNILILNLMFSQYLAASFYQMYFLLFISCRKSLILIKLIIELSFELTFWTWIKIELSCSHFQLDLSRVTHIFNLMWLDSTENWVNSTQLIKNSSLMSRELNIEIFSTFALSFCIIFLIESHEEKT